MLIHQTIEAIQWNKDGDHPQVVLAGPKLARRGPVGYITGMTPLMHWWVELEPQKTRPVESDDNLFHPVVVQLEHPETKELYWRRCWNFAMWKFSGPTVETVIAPDDLFCQDCQAIERLHWGSTPYPEWRPYGWLQPPAIGGRLVVYPGDWIVTSGTTVRTIMSDIEFKKFYPNGG